MTTPLLGQTVLYRLTEREAKEVNLRRARFFVEEEFSSAFARGFHYRPSFEGNEAIGGDLRPAVVVAIFGPFAPNLQVFLDGNDSLWVCSRSEGDNPGQWVSREPDHSDTEKS
jgi:hypothetical protein